MNDLISIVVPVYNSKKFLEHCLESLMQQTYKNIEIIVVDDGSTDASGDICDRLALADSRLRVFHTENHGVSHARNFGVAQSKGKFIAFVDSDDYVSPHYIEHLASLIEKYDADISVCDCKRCTVDDDIEFSDISDFNVEILDGKSACAKMFTATSFAFYVIWCKLCRADIIKRYPFALNRKFEDTEVLPKWFYNSAEIVVSDCSLYAYVQHDQSIMTKTVGVKSEDRYWALTESAKFFENSNEPDLAGHAWDRFVDSLTYDMIKYRIDNTDEINKMLSEKGNYLSGKSKMKIMLSLYFPSIYRLFGKLRWH